MYVSFSATPPGQGKRRKEGLRPTGWERYRARKEEAREAKMKAAELYVCR